MFPSIFFIYALTVGYSPQPLQLSIDNRAAFYPAYSTGLSAGFSIGDPAKTHLEITGSATTWENMISLLGFSPAIMHYGFEVSFMSSFFNLSISHLCIHPVIAASQRTTYIFGGDTTITAQFHASHKLF